MTRMTLVCHTCSIQLKGLRGKDFFEVHQAGYVSQDFLYCPECYKECLRRVTKPPSDDLQGLSGPAYDAVTNVLARLSAKGVERANAEQILAELNDYAKESELEESDRVIADRYLMKMWLSAVEVTDRQTS